MPRVTAAHATLRLGATTELSDWVHAVAWSPDSRTVAAACADGSVVTLDSEQATRVVHRHDAPATTLSWSSQGVLASGGEDGAVRIADRKPVAGTQWVGRLAWRPDGGLLAVAQGHHVSLYDPDGRQTATSKPLEATVSCLAWHPRGVEIAAGSYGGVQLLRGLDAGIAKELAWKGSVLELAISPDGKRLAHGNQDASVHFWNLRKSTELEMWGYETKVRELAWRHDGRYLATGGGTCVTLWDFAGRGPSGSKPIDLDQHTDAISWLGFRPASKLLASTAADGMAMLWKPGNDDMALATVALDDRITTAAWSPDGRHLALGGADGTLAITDVTEDEP